MDLDDHARLNCQFKHILPNCLDLFSTFFVLFFSAIDFALFGYEMYTVSLLKHSVEQFFL